MSYNATFGTNSAAAPKPGERFAMTVCRKVGDAGSILQGAGEIAGGGTLAGGGAVACGTVVLCFVGGGAAAVAGAGIAAHGAVTAAYGTWNLVASAVNTCLAASTSGGGGGPPSTPTPAPTPSREVVRPTESYYERARNNALQEFGEIDPATRQPVVSGLRASKAFGKIVGFETKVNGVWKRFRLDYDPVKGPHINIEIGKGPQAIRIAFPWKGNEADFLREVARLQ